MQHSFFKPVIFGILLGGILFVASFVMIRVLFFVLIAGAIIKVFSRHRMGGMGGRFGAGFADRIRSMSEEEYENFKGNRGAHWASHHRNNPFEDRETEVRPIIIE